MLTLLIVITTAVKGLGFTCALSKEKLGLG
jgi:hypothetical protein